MCVCVCGGGGGQGAGGRRRKGGGCEAGVLSGWEPGEKHEILFFLSFLNKC